jgi:hypothetical protein
VTPGPTALVDRIRGARLAPAARKGRGGVTVIMSEAERAALVGLLDTLAEVEGNVPASAVVSRPIRAAWLRLVGAEP